MTHMPRSVARRILERSERNEVAVVVPKKGSPSRVFSLETYLRMKEVPRSSRPWESRRSRTRQPDPLGAVDGRVTGSLRRQDIYE